MVVLHVRSAAPTSASSSPSQDGDEETEFLYEYAALGTLAGLQAALLSHSAGASDSERGAWVLLLWPPPPRAKLVRVLDEVEAYASKRGEWECAIPLINSS